MQKKQRIGHELLRGAHKIGFKVLCDICMVFAMNEKFSTHSWHERYAIKRMHKLLMLLDSDSIVHDANIVDAHILLIKLGLSTYTINLY